MKLIPLRDKDGDVVDHAMVDDEDFDWLSTFDWSETKRPRTSYALTMGNPDGSRYMHRIIYARHNPAPLPRLLDHEDRNGLNNQKENLRPSNHSQNAANQDKWKTNSSKYKGVRYYPDRKVWEVMIGYGMKTEYVGRFKDERDAAIAYDIKAGELFGEFAGLNLPTVDAKDRERVDRQLKSAKSIGNHSSKYLGVYWDKTKRRFTAQYVSDSPEKKTYHIGRYLSEEEAARARDKKIVELGLNKPLNFP